MVQRAVYDPLLASSKSSQLLSLTAISGIILRTEHGEQSTTEYLCDQSLDDGHAETRYVYASEESVFDYEQMKSAQNPMSNPSITRIQLAYQNQILKLKTQQYSKLGFSNSKLPTQPSESYHTDRNSDRLSQLMKTRQKIYQKRGRLKCSLQLMIIHLSRNLASIRNSNTNLVKHFFSKMKQQLGSQKIAKILNNSILTQYKSAIAKLKGQRIKKISLKGNKIFEIEDILNREMEKRNKKIHFRTLKNM